MQLVQKIITLGVLYISLTSQVFAEDLVPSYVSLGGIGYSVSCSERGTTLTSINPTFRMLGYRTTERPVYSQNEVITLNNANSCSASSVVMGEGKWCYAGGSNGGFVIDFTDTSTDAFNFNKIEFFGQELLECAEQSASCRCQ